LSALAVPAVQAASTDNLPGEAVGVFDAGHRMGKLNELLRHRAVWRSRDGLDTDHNTSPSGYEVLDALLPGGGWPVGALTEIVVERQGLGELALVMPALEALSRQGRTVAWVAPPYVPYAPALEQRGLDLSQVLWLRSNGLEERLWAAEQTLRSGVCGAVLLWLTPHQAPRINVRNLRRLQLAAEQGESVAFLFWRRAVTSSPAVLRVRVFSAPQGVNASKEVAGGTADDAVSAGSWGGRHLQLEILKCRGLGTNKVIGLQFA